MRPTHVACINKILQVKVYVLDNSSDNFNKSKWRRGRIWHHTLCLQPNRSICTCQVKQWNCS